MVGEDQGILTQAADPRRDVQPKLAPEQEQLQLSAAGAPSRVDSRQGIKGLRPAAAAQDKSTCQHGHGLRSGT